ncbi:MAG: Holliday junction branch migration protein RuvA [Elusimicrobiota bacterium]|nr:hypothetical protein [Endomicrobiia bacterium]MCX7910546.1 hypothetical protein [Endomicrobiia bacterium]MDW8166751.1 Holliday junction branch migration protein RuvA [Elusimicrobiota bacterium]
MYNYIEGEVVEINIKDGMCVVDVNGVGYEILTLESTLQEIKIPQKVKFYIVEVSSGLYSGGFPTLYGFCSKEEKDIFLAFKNNLSNVGPKKALEYLEKVKKNINEFKIAIITKNAKMLTSIFGFKSSSAEKIIAALSNLEIFAKKDFYKSEIDINLYTDLVSALVNLGYKETQVKNIVEKILFEQKEFNKIKNLDLTQLIQIALKELSSVKE